MSHQNFISRGLKYKKVNKQIKRNRGVASNNFLVRSDAFLLKVYKNSSIFLPHQLEAARRVLRRQLNRDVSLKYYTCCDLPCTSKSSGVRMGKGKGNIEKWVSSLPAGKLLFSVENTSYFQSINACRKALKKFSGFQKFFPNRFVGSRIRNRFFEK